ncbi:MAG: hypothetical protein KGI00_02585 [Candidatus Micrarchaeota archaeon]|nr:hypothetical protein [Candidatus Micrarchaeota archaeon]MDE1849594.1 hypothetical protein [Candidatus Micrarchaeota archaeon]
MKKSLTDTMVSSISEFFKKDPKLSKRERTRKWKITTLLGLAYILVIIFGFVYSQIIGTERNIILQILNIIPLADDTYPFFLQGLLTFCSILFGFYSIVLIQTIPKLRLFLQKYIISFSPKYRINMMWGALLIAIFFIPVYYLFDSITYSLAGIGAHGFIAEVSITNTTNSTTNQTTNYMYKSYIEQYSKINSRAINDTFTASWYIFIDLVLYSLIELGVVHAAIQHSIKLLRKYRV